MCRCYVVVGNDPLDAGSDSLKSSAGQHLGYLMVGYEIVYKFMTMAVAYLSLQRCLETLARSLADGTVKQNSGEPLLHCWQQELAPLQGEALDTTVYHQWRSLHTELYRELRLLNLDLLFLGNSRSGVTQAAKQKAAGDRLDKLLQYCGQIQQIIVEGDPHKLAE